MPMRRWFRLLMFAVLAACQQEQYVPATAVPVRTEVAKRSDFTPSTTILGVVRPAQTIPLTALKGGTVTYPRRFAQGLETGARVSRGEIVAELKNDQLLFARKQTRLQMEAADADYERARRSFAEGVVSSAEHSAYQVRARLAHSAYEEATRESGTMRILAPAAGTLIVSKPWPSGVAVDAGTVLAHVATDGRPSIESSVPASQRALLRPGLPVRFTAPGQVTGMAAIAEVASVVDAAGTSRVVASIVSDAAPPPGTGVDMHVELEKHVDVLTVPEEAIVAAADGPAVFVASMAEGDRRTRVKRVRVEVGGRADGRVQILSGLRDGDRVVVSGAEALSDGTLIIEAEESK